MEKLDCEPEEKESEKKTFTQIPVPSQSMLFIGREVQGDFYCPLSSRDEIWELQLTNKLG